MPWGDNGTTNKRVIVDQSYNFTWTNQTLRIPTRAFNQVGYLRRLIAKMPTTEGTLTVTASNPVTVTPAIQNPMFRAIASVDITAQGIAPLYQLSRGIALSYLEYVNNGANRGLPSYSDAIGTLAQVGAVGNPAVHPYGRLAADPKGYFGDVASQSSGAGTAQTVRYGGFFDLPLTEWIRFPPAVGKDASGNPVQIAAQEVEVGLVTLQNTQQNVKPNFVLNPLWQPNATVLGMYDAPFRAAATAPSAGSIGTLMDLYTEFYDVPTAAADQPPSISQMFVISRTTTEEAVAGQSLTHTFQPAGNLMRAIYVVLDANGGVLDISALSVQDPTLSGSGVALTQPPAAQGADGTVTMQWGASVIKYQEKFQMNLARHADIYGDSPPSGCLIHDLFADRTLVDLLNTAQLTSARTVLTGLPAAAAYVHTIEERLVPVRPS